MRRCRNLEVSSNLLKPWQGLLQQFGEGEGFKAQFQRVEGPSHDEDYGAFAVGDEEIVGSRYRRRLQTERPCSRLRRRGVQVLNHLRKER